jgi:hypothetical protein
MTNDNDGARIIALATPPTVDDQIREAAVQLLESALAQARAGKVEGVILILKYNDNEWSNFATGIKGFSDAMGYLEITKLQWFEKYQENLKNS